ncbi:MAG: hypothetical protein IPJ77_24595 [Planctomycetes bacterium]|nr:hypothetical protein [Planctomycetota bacterium]
MLLEQSYWRNRLQVLRLARPSVLLIPRPELTTNAVEVDEFRIRTHDGIRLFGLRARHRMGTSQTPARIRVVGPCELPEVDARNLGPGETEFVFQSPAGRRLEDRVLDVLRICQVATQRDDVRADDVRLVSTDLQRDEFLIASQLLADEVPAPLPDLEGESSMVDRRPR